MKDWMRRKDSMIRTAIDIVDELGVHGLTVKELAKREGVAQSLIYKNFAGMDEVVAEVVDYYALYDRAIIDSVIDKDISPRGKISEYIKSYIEYYANYPAVTSLVNSYESLKSYPSTCRKIEAITTDRINSLGLLFELTAKAGERPGGFDPHTAAVVVWGYLSHMVLLWRIGNHAFALRDEVLRTTEELIDALI